MNELQKIDFSWKIESCSDPLFCYDEYGLKVSFMIFMGKEIRQSDISKWLSLYNVEDELQIPDKEYNHSGYRIANFSFSGFHSMYCTDRESGLAAYMDVASDPPAVYREVNKENNTLGYVFVGHDLFLSVKAQAYCIDIHFLQ
ncbi:hypothetical protein [Paenibacillus bovis]|uniref:Uncharacterized protein n=1 Tax=Paenibacillus bovis TaxID=1616788 RepID=A0A172ZFT6_9BACL|nr:hypothetical protein [Paenibacillus bovis]ANF96495.1 hypothetical protein AR543_11090 [Paenibacillus bovis]